MNYEACMRLSLALLVGVTFAGCDIPVPEPKTFAEINDQVIQKSCAKFSSCHSPLGYKSAGNMNLQVDPYNQLVNIPATNVRALAENQIRVVPGSLEQSFLWTKLNLQTATDPKVDYGEPMPNKSGYLPAPQLEGIRKWILRGAPND